MKRILPLCLAFLISLAACSAQGAVIPAVSPAAVMPAEPAATALPSGPPEASAPPASPFSISLESQAVEAVEWEGGLSSLPQRLVDGQAELSYLFAEPSATVLLAQLPDKDIALYGILDEAHPEERCLLRIGERAWVYDLQWATPRCYLPQLHSGDFDGDGVEELALLAYVGSGTGVSVWTLGIVEPDGEIPALRAVFSPSYEDALTPCFSCNYNTASKKASLIFNRGEPEMVDFSRFTPSLPADAQLTAAVGNIVEYAVEDSVITVCLGVNLYGGDIPPTVLYPADIEAQVVYNGEGFFLRQPVMIPAVGF